MRRCIIHIGTHKTGSTSLQRYLHANRQQLESAGVIYPVTATEIAHHALFRDIGGRAAGSDTTDLAALSDRLKKSDADVAIISSELFSTLDDAQLTAKLAQAVTDGGFAPEAVLFVRPQHLLFNSMYTQRTKMLAEGRRFAAYATRQLKQSAYDFSSLAGPWRGAPYGMFTAIPFTKSVIGKGIEKAFFDALGLGERLAAMKQTVPLKAVNFSNGPKAVELCRRLSAHGGQERFASNYLAVRRFAQRQAARRNWNDRGFVGLTGELRDDLRDGYRTSNDAFAQGCWNRSWDDVFKADYDREFTPNELHPSVAPEADMSDVAAIFEEACDRYDPERLARRSWPSRLWSRLTAHVAGVSETSGKER